MGFPSSYHRCEAASRSEGNLSLKQDCTAACREIKAAEVDMEGQWARNCSDLT